MTWTIRPRSEGPGGLHYWSEGQGPALVLIHGVGLRAEAWGAMVPLLAPHVTIYAVDMPGHGASPLNDTVTLADYTDRFAAFIAALDTPVAVAGHSMGALIALDLATSHSENLHSVAALNAVFERTADAAQAVRARAAALTENGPSDPMPTLERWFGADPTGEQRAAATACRTWLTQANRKGYAQAYTVFAQHNGPTGTALARMHIPALFLTGAEDSNSTPEMSQRMSTLAPHGHTHIVQDAAHMVPMTHPGIVANELISHIQGSTL